LASEIVNDMLYDSREVFRLSFLLLFVVIPVLLFSLAHLKEWHGWRITVNACAWCGPSGLFMIIGSHQDGVGVRYALAMFFVSTLSLILRRPIDSIGVGTKSKRDCP